MHTPLINILSKEKKTIATHLTSVVPALMILLTVGWISFDLEIQERVLLTRYASMIFVGVMAFLTPHLLYPDSNKTLMLQLNPAQSHLFRYHNIKLRPIGYLALVVFFVMSFVDIYQPDTDLLAKSITFLNSGLMTIAILLFVQNRYLAIGEQSQSWSEGQAGQKGLTALRNIGMVSPIPPGMYPTFLATTVISFLGMMAIVASAAIPFLYFSSLPFVLLLMYSVFKIYHAMFRYDRLTYQSDAFYNELMGQSVGKSGEAREPAPYKAIYWVPGRWRHAVWTQIIQMDRKQPIGRFIALFCIIFWLMLWLGAPSSWAYAWIVFLILSKNLFNWPVSEKKISPPSFQWWIMGPMDWIVTRFFLQLRWIPPLALALSTAALFSAAITWHHVGYVLLFDILVSFVTSWIFTRKNESAFKKRFV